MNHDNVWEDLEKQRLALENKKKAAEERKESCKARSSKTKPRTQAPSNSARSASRRCRIYSNEDDLDDDNELMQKRWAGCEHWMCPRYLPRNFDYSKKFICPDCS